MGPFPRPQLWVWGRSATTTSAAIHPRAIRDVTAFIERVRRSAGNGQKPDRLAEPGGQVEGVAPVTPYPPVRVREAFNVQPRLEALAIVRGEHVCSNDDVIKDGLPGRR